MESTFETPLRLVPIQDIPVERITFGTGNLQATGSRWRKMMAAAILQLIQCIIVAVVAVGIYWFVSHHLYQSVQVDGPSMYPTLHDTDHYFLNRWIYRLRDPRSSEIVVLKDPHDNVYEVKRVIATSGDSVYIKNGAVYVNGKRLNESYLQPLTKTYAAEKSADEFICCGQDQFFVLGDNREVSYDSRYFGPVHRENILGKLVF